AARSGGDVAPDARRHAGRACRLQSLARRRRCHFIRGCAAERAHRLAGQQRPGPPGRDRRASGATARRGLSDRAARSGPSFATCLKLMGRGGARLRQQYVADEVDDGVSGWTGEAPTAVDEGTTAPKGRLTKGRDEPAGSRVAQLATVAPMPAQASAPAAESDR